jgi:hypothetical protein
MDHEVEQRVRAIVDAVYPYASDWTIVGVGDITVALPPVDVTSDGRIDGIPNSYFHYQPGDDMYITIGTIHLRRPMEEA